eukprot:scaffold24202_cov44-Phaeocystis_antarctica.AAC.1
MPPAGESREVELISAELARSQVASVIFGVRTSMGRCTFSSSVLRIGMIYGGPDTSQPASYGYGTVRSLECTKDDLLTPQWGRAVSLVSV